MGPRPLGRGIILVRSQGAPLFDQLQWGRGRSSHRRRFAVRRSHVRLRWRPDICVAPSRRIIRPTKPLLRPALTNVAGSIAISNVRMVFVVFVVLATVVSLSRIIIASCITENRGMQGLSLRPLLNHNADYDAVGYSYSKNDFRFPERQRSQRCSRCTRDRNSLGVEEGNI